MKNNKQKERVLVVAAHPDDEVLGCGATIAKHAAEGDEVWVLILGEGVTSRKGVSKTKQKEELAALRKSAEKANNVLGVKRLLFRDFPDNKFDSVPLLDIIHEVEAITDEFKPTIVYTHHYADVNIDHRKVAEAIEAVTRPMEGASVKKVLAFEVPSSSEWNFAKPGFFRANVFIDIRNTLETAIKALQCYGSEIRDFPHPRSVEYVRALAKVRGGQSGMYAAEAFSLVYETERRGYEE